MPEQLPAPFSGDYNDLVNTPAIPPAGIEEAPQDGKVYGRSDGAWTEVTGGGGGGGGVDSVNGSETGVVRGLGIQEMDDFGSLNVARLSRLFTSRPTWVRLASGVSSIDANGEFSRGDSLTFRRRSIEPRSACDICA